MRAIAAGFVVMVCLGAAADELPAPTRQTVRAVVDLDAGEAAEVTLADGTKVRVELVSTDAALDPIRHAVRKATAVVRINGQEATLTSGAYNLPVTVASGGGVQIDCPITRAYYAEARGDSWALKKDARLRLWPAGSKWIEADAFGYPVKQKWFVSGTQMGNVPTFVDAGDQPPKKPRDIYYHSGLDIGGTEAMTQVVAATDGLVVSVAAKSLEGLPPRAVGPRYDVVYLRDDRGWFYRYSHLNKIDPAITLGSTVKRGQPIGLLGKEGASGGWSHLHFEIKAPQPSGDYGTEEGYAYIWQAYVQEHSPAVIAVARPHQFIRAGDTATLDASKSWSATPGSLNYEWTLHDGSHADGPTLTRTYDKAGVYSEIVKVTNASGAFDYDFQPVHVIDMAAPDKLPPTIQLTYWPSLHVKAGDELTFKTRSFRNKAKPVTETIDFGDGSPPATVHSDGNAKALNPNGFAITTHKYAKPGNYIAVATTTNEHGLTATTHCFVRVEPGK